MLDRPHFQKGWDALSKRRRLILIAPYANGKNSAARICELIRTNHGIDLTRNQVIGVCERHRLPIAGRGAPGSQRATQSLSPPAEPGRHLVPWKSVDDAQRMSLVMTLVREGLGVRAIARGLQERFGVEATESAVRCFCKARNINPTRERCGAKRKLPAKIARLPESDFSPIAPVLDGHAQAMIDARPFAPTRFSGAPRAVLEAQPHTCRWPTGDPSGPDFSFCGKPTQPGKSYCAGCRSVAGRSAERQEN
ncbi:MAG: GcrA family cell cycle regulator [Pseudomonadota bacterium]